MIRIVKFLVGLLAVWVGYLWFERHILKYSPLERFFRKRYETTLLRMIEETLEMIPDELDLDDRLDYVPTLDPKEAR